ncbi:PHP domain-containing protein [Candidatus Peregrinibacteria bacterium]|nr:PHP domain-containing protein [Candidatus Peregrinibacteria bacterium]
MSVKLKAQLHVHTKQDPVENIKHTEKQKIDFAAKHGYEVMAITCHNVFIFNEDLRKYAEEKRILLIPAIEKSVERKHVLILNADVEAQKIKTFNDLRLYKKNYPDCLMIAAHPYYPGPISLHKKLEEHIDIFDAIEYSWYHSKRINKYNEKAVAMAEKHEKTIVGTSDNHLLPYFDETFSTIESKEKTVESVLKAIRDGHVTFVSHDQTLWTMFYVIVKMHLLQLIKKISLR